MRRSLTRAFLVLLAMSASRDALASDCRRYLLTDDERNSLAEVVLKTTGMAMNPTWIRACRHWGVELETVRVPQPDGTERRSWLHCEELIRSSVERWHCIEYPSRGFRADTYPGEPGVWVAMNIPMALPDARRDVSLAFALLARDGEIPSCAGVNGKGRSLAGLRAEITGGDGNLTFSRSADGYSLEGGFVVVDFERVENAGPRVLCWREPDIVVTS